MLRVRIIITVLISLMWSVYAFAIDIKLQWEPNPESDIAGYKVYYGVNGLSNPTHLNVSNQTFATTISGLDPTLNYSFAIAAYNTSGLEAPYSNVVTALESVPPSVSISNQSNNSTVSSIIIVAVAASDNVGVSKVELFLNGVLIAADAASPYTFSWDTTLVTNGSYTLSAKAYDAAGNVGQSANVSVTVNNPVPDITVPTVTAFTMPAVATSLTVPITGFTASDNVGVTGYLVAEGSVPPSLGAAGWTASAPTSFTFSGYGSKTVYAWARDAAGNLSNGLGRSIVITKPDVIAPTITITSPLAGAVIRGTTTVNMVAADNVAVSKVELYINGKLFGTKTTAPYSFSWASGSYPLGSNSLVAYAYDAAGNKTQSAAVQVTVQDAVAPVVTVSAPLNNARISSSTTIKASATDNKAVVKMTVTVDGRLRATFNSATLSWTASSLSGGTHTIVVRAHDAAGNVGSKTVTVYR